MNEPRLITTHKLQFESAEGKEGFLIFRIGTCQGQWGNTSDSYFILSVINDQPGNGHLEDVFEWFEFACKRDGRNLLVLSISNPGLYLHMVLKRDFLPLDQEGNNVIKVFNKKQYKKLLKKGNEILIAPSMQCI